MLNQQLAQGIIGISIDMSKFNADLARINAALAGLGGGASGAGVGGGVASGVAAGVSAGFARGSAQARSPLGQFTSTAVAGGVASGMAQGVARGRAATAPLTQAVAQAVNAGMAQGVDRGITYAGGRWRNARGQFVGMGGSAAGGVAGGGAGIGMGALQGLGLSGFAANPAMALGSMAGGGLRAGWEMVASGIKESAATAIDLQSTFLDLQRVTGGTAENTQTLKQAVFDIANKQAGVSVADVTGIMMGAAKAGVGDKEGPEGLVRFTRGIARVRNALGEGEGLNADQLTEGMTKVMNLFHLGTGSAEGLGSALVKLANISTGTGASIMNVTTGLSGTLASLGSDAATAMSFGSVVADVGLTDAQGANSLSQILRMMASDTKDMAEATGIPIVQLQQMIRTDLVGALELVVSKFRQINEVDPIKGQEFIKGLGFEGVRTAGAFQQLGSMIEQVRSRAETARGEMQTLEALTSADVLKSDQTKTGIQKMANAFEELRDAIGTHFLPGIDLATEAMTKLARAAAGNLPAILSGAGTAATDVVRAVGGPAGTAAVAAVPGLLGSLFGAGPLSAPAIPGAATGMGPPVAGGPAGTPSALMAGLPAPPDDAGTAAGRAFLAEVTKIPGVGSTLARPEFAGLPGVAGFQQAAQSLADPAAAFFAAADAVGAPGPWKTRRELTTPADFVGPTIPDKVRNALDRAATGPRPFVDPDFVGPPIPRAVQDARDRAAVAPFHSQTFGDMADFGRTAIQTALSDKDPALKMVDKQDETIKVLQSIDKKVGPAGPANPGMVTLHGES